MEKIKKFLLINKWEILSISSLSLIFFILVYLFVSHMGNIIVDCGREAYFPEQVLNGKVLYKDIFNIMGPLSYQINALLYGIFGINLDSLRLAGTVNTFLTLSFLYILSRLFTSKEISWAITLFIMVSCAFSPWVFNYIFPYSFAVSYAFCAFLISSLLLVLYFKNSKHFLIPLSWFFIGVSLSSKPDYILFVPLLITITLFLRFYKKLDNKYILYSIFSFLIIPFLCFSILFLQGLTLNDFLIQFKTIGKFSVVPSIHYFYSNLVGFYPKIESLSASLKKCGQIIPLSTFLLASFYFYLKFSQNKFKNIEGLILSLGSVVLFLYGFYSYIDDSPFLLFSWLPLFSLFLLAFVFIQLIKTKNYYKEGPFTLFIIISLIGASKTFFFLDMHVYGTFTFPLLFMVISVFVVEYLPGYYPFIDKIILKKAFLIFLLILTAFFMQHLLSTTKNNQFLSTKRGEIYNPPEIVIPTQQTINYIQKTLKPDDKVWIIPEGIMINFITNHPSNGVYYSPLPHYIEAFGEDKIISDTQKEKINYIIINNRNSSDYGPAYMCKDYGLKICNWVYANYSKEKVFDNNRFKITIYKKL